MTTEQVNHLSRSAVAMFSGVVVWVLYLLRAGDFLELLHADELSAFLGGEPQTVDAIKMFVAENVVSKYIGEACSIILFLIATNTIVEVLHNNGVFNSLVMWMRMKNSRVFLWVLSLLTVIISANVDNITTVVLMLSILTQIVRSHSQKLIYACTILVSATLGGCLTTIGDMTTIMLWNHGVITPSAYFAGMAIPVFSTLICFNLLQTPMLHGRVEVVSFITTPGGGLDDSLLAWWQKLLLLLTGIIGLWMIPTFHLLTRMPVSLGALCVLALVWVVEGLVNIHRDGLHIYVRREHLRQTEFIGIKMVLYFIGIYLGVGALAETNALNFMGDILGNYIHNEYLTCMTVGALSSVIDNVPLVLAGMNMFELNDGLAVGQEFALNGTYWMLLSYCCSMGGVLFLVGTLAGPSVLQVAKMKFSWFLRNYTWRVLVAWGVGLLMFMLIDTL